MNILILADSLAYGGAETHIYELSRSLFSLGHTVAVLSGGGETAKAIEACGIRHITCQTHRFFELMNTVRAEKPDILHAHTRKTALLCVLLSRVLKRPAVFTAHAHFRTGGAGELVRLFHGPVIAVSEDIAAHMNAAFGIPRERLFVIGNGVDTDRFGPSPAPVASTLRLLTVSRMDRDCAVAAELLLRLLPMLAERTPVHLTVVGGGDALPQLKELATAAEARVGSDTVTFAGAQTDVRPYMADCDLFVGVSRAAFEAMSMGKPTILCGNEGFLGLFTEEIAPQAEQSNFCGRGQKKPTESALLEEILTFLALSKEERDALGSFGRRYVTEYHGMQKIAEETLAVYRRAVQKCRFDVFLCGYYGYGNTGDELILESLCSGLHRQDQTLALGALCGPSPVCGEACPVPRRQPFAVLGAIRHSRIILLGGGTLLQNRTSHRSLYYYLALLAAARIMKRPYGMLLGGIAPIRGRFDRFLCRFLLSKAAFLGVRDLGSLSVLSDLGISPDRLHVGADPVLEWPVDPTPHRPNALVVFPRTQQNTPSFLHSVAHLSRELDLPVVLGTMDQTLDAPAAKQIALGLSSLGVSATVWDTASLPDILSLISSAVLILSARLHALILAYRLGVPTLALSDDEKLRSFFSEAYGRPVAAHLSLPALPTAALLVRAASFALSHTDAAARADRLSLLTKRTDRQYALLVEKLGKWEKDG